MHAIRVDIDQDVDVSSTVFTERMASVLRSLNSSINASIALLSISPHLTMVSMSTVSVVEKAPSFPQSGRTKYAYSCFFLDNFGVKLSINSAPAIARPDCGVFCSLRSVFEPLGVMLVVLLHPPFPRHLRCVCCTIMFLLS